MSETVFILSTADFHAAVWTNKQHLAIRLAKYKRVVYIESLGLRRPRLSIADAKRVWSRAFATRAPEPTPAGLQIVKPHVIPLHSNRLVQALNKRLLNHQIRQLIHHENSPTVLWTFSPVTYGIEKYFDKVIYHSVDLLHTQPHLPHDLLLHSEKLLTSTADHLIASSTGVANHLKELTDKPVKLWENVADTSLYVNAEATRRYSRVVFAGNLTPSKVDFQLITDLADAGIDIVLAGPSSIDGTRATTNVLDLLEHPNVKHAGNLQPPDLAQLLNACAVGIIPYSLNSYTAGVYPMKVYEYLASGLAVVSTMLPSLAHINDEDIVTVPREDFVNKVLASLRTDANKVAKRKQRAASHSWDNRVISALSLLGQSQDAGRSYGTDRQ